MIQVGSHSVLHSTYYLSRRHCTTRLMVAFQRTSQIQPTIIFVYLHSSGFFSRTRSHCSSRSALNTVAVLWLRFESRLLTATEKPTSKLTIEEARIRSRKSSHGSTLLKRRAAMRLQYASIALVVSFAVTSGPYQVITAIQFIAGL